MKLAAVVGLALLLVAGCGVVAPQLVRDEANLFSGDARVAAEQRLRAIAVTHDLWAYIITEPDGDPPRMLDAPMAEADAQGIEAVAILLSADRVLGGGYSAATVERDDSPGLTPPDVDGQLVGDPDAALDRLVDYLEAWARTRPPAGAGG